MLKIKKIWANLSVENLERTAAFYTALGFKPNGASDELTSFCFGDDDFTIHFFVKERFESGVNGHISGGAAGNEVVFSLSAENRDEVDQWRAEVSKAGGTIYAEPQEVGKGYHVGFADPDGHKFNVLYWPA